ncbi:MAG: hypothetical protein QOE37_1708, partial [Microbacteriaceae bacterium]|nr:hypothetical protein [Microbacteriaceae bacterium]
MRWPWQRRAAESPAPVSPPPAPAGWSFLPPLQRTIGPIELVSAPAAFPGRLAAWTDPSFVAPSIGSGRRLDGPSGVIELDPPERRAPTVVSRSLAASTAPVVRAAPALIGAPAPDVLDEDAAAPNPSGQDGAVSAEELGPPIPEPEPEPQAESESESEAARGVEAPTADHAPERPAPTAAARVSEAPETGPAGSGLVRPTAQRLQRAVQRGEWSGVSVAR